MTIFKTLCAVLVGAFVLLSAGSYAQQRSLAQDYVNRGQVKNASRLFGPDGRYQGNIRKSGRIFDRQGNYQGYIDNSSRIRGIDGSYQGIINKSGRLYGRDARIFEYFDRGAVHALLDEHLSGTTNRRLLIWSLLCFEQWIETFLENGKAP